MRNRACESFLVPQKLGPGYFFGCTANPGGTAGQDHPGRPHHGLQHATVERWRGRIEPRHAHQQGGHQQKGASPRALPEEGDRGPGRGGPLEPRPALRTHADGDPEALLQTALDSGQGPVPVGLGFEEVEGDGGPARAFGFPPPGEELPVPVSSASSHHQGGGRVQVQGEYSCWSFVRSTMRRT